MPDPVTPAKLYLTVPTDIGQITTKTPGRYTSEAVAVLPHPDVPDEVVLAATDGRMLAIVNTPIVAEGDVEEAGLHPQWVPRSMAKTHSRGPRVLRLGHGKQDSLFGSTRTWVDDGSGTFAPHPEGGVFPNFSDLLPPLGDQDLIVTIKTDALLALARALNSHDASSREQLTLVIRPPEKSAQSVSRPMIAIGNAGIGLMMPVANDAAKLSREAYRRTRALFARAQQGVQFIAEAKITEEELDNITDGPEPTTTPEAWRSVKVSELGLPEGLVKQLAEGTPPVKTLGDIVDFQSDGRRRLTDLQGIGEAKATQLEDALVRFWAAHPEYSSKEEPKSEEVPAVGSDPLLEQAYAIQEQEGRITVSMLQRRLGIGYVRASQIAQELATSSRTTSGASVKPSPGDLASHAPSSPAGVDQVPATSSSSSETGSSPSPTGTPSESFEEIHLGLAELKQWGVKQTWGQFCSGVNGVLSKSGEYSFAGPEFDRPNQKWFDLWWCGYTPKKAVQEYKKGGVE